MMLMVWMDPMFPFQSSPGQKAGCNPLHLPHLHQSHVSILTRPEGRMQSELAEYHRLVPRGFNPHPARRPDAIRTRRIPSSGSTWFQSSPGQKAGCNRNIATSIPPELMFQSSPGQKAGCNQSATIPRFQSSPGQKAGCNPPTHRTGRSTEHVSILTRPEGRMQCSRSKKTGGNGTLLTSFNPHPARRPDAIRFQAGSDQAAAVSILTRPEGRMQSSL